MARYLFLYLVWLSVSLGFKEGKHLRVELLYDRVGPIGRSILDIFNYAVLTAFSLLMTVLSWQYILSLMSNQVLSPALHIPMSLAYACLPISMLAVAVRVLIMLIKSCVSFGSPAADGKGDAA